MTVAEHFKRIEQAALDITESKEPIDRTIILWWGLDGLRLNEDGTIEAVCRGKKKSYLSSAEFKDVCTFYADNAPVGQISPPPVPFFLPAPAPVSLPSALPALNAAHLACMTTPLYLQQCCCIPYGSNTFY